MSRREENYRIDQDLERYLDDIIYKVQDRIDDQRDDEEPEIRRLDLKEDLIISAACKVVEVLYFDDQMSIKDAINDAASMVVNASIYQTLDRDRNLDRLPRDLERDLEDDNKDVKEITGSRGRNRSSRDDRNDRNSRGDSRRSAAGSASRSGGSRNEDRDSDRGKRERSRGSSGRDDRDQRDEEQRRAEEREKRRKGETSDNVRDNVVKTASENLDVNTPAQITKAYIAVNPLLFCVDGKQLALGPVYWLGSQVPVVLNKEITFTKVNEMEWEKHRTDLYLNVRKTIAPTATVRDQALSQAINGRNRFVSETVEKLEKDVNVVQEQTPLEVKQVYTSDQILGQYYGDGTPMSMIQTCLAAAKLRYLPDHPVIMKVEQYPFWVMNKELTVAVENLYNVNQLNHLVPALIAVSNECTAQQWAYFHDHITGMINQILKVELESRPYLTSIISEWPDFAKWLETTSNGSMVQWFNNGLNAQLRRVLHINKYGSKLAHASVDGTDNKYASISSTTNLIYVPVESENFGAASATKLGRVMESVTPKLYQLLDANINVDCERNLLVTKSDEFVKVYRRESSLVSKVILMGDCNWS